LEKIAHDAVSRALLQEVVDMAGVVVKREVFQPRGKRRISEKE
jgi:hypothetical protein